MPYARVSRSGFVLLEVIAALMIVSVSGIAVFLMLGSQFRAAARAQEALQADVLLRDRLGRIEMLTRRELEQIPDSLRRGRFDAPFERFTWSAQATRMNNQRNMFEVQVQIESPNVRYVVGTHLYRPLRNGQ